MYRRGFTLIELLIVIVIIGVLCAVVVPLHLNYRDEAKDTEAFVFIDHIIQTEKHNFQKYSQYYSASTPEEFLKKGVDTAESGWFVFIVVASIDPPGFTITATNIETGEEITYNTLGEYEGGNDPSGRGKKKGHWKRKK